MCLGGLPRLREAPERRIGQDGYSSGARGLHPILRPWGKHAPGQSHAERQKTGCSLHRPAFPFVTPSYRGSHGLSRVGGGREAHKGP
jgi:hypothetical protein